MTEHHAMPYSEGSQATAGREEQALELELDGEFHRQMARHEFTQAGLSTLEAGTWGGLAGVLTAAMGPLALLAAIPAAVSVHSAFRHLGRGIQEAADGAATETALQLAYDSSAEWPGQRVQEAVPIGRLVPGPGQGRQV
jgi:hypothetical protein